MFGTDPNVNVALHIFDHTIKPILTYGCEIWASNTKKFRSSDQTLETLYKDLHAEKLHLKYCKYILGVHAKASNLATIGEFPLYHDICENITKYYSRLLQMNSDILLGQTL